MIIFMPSFLFVYSCLPCKKIMTLFSTNKKYDLFICRRMLVFLSFFFLRETNSQYSWLLHCYRISTFHSITFSAPGGPESYDERFNPVTWNLNIVYKASLQMTLLETVKGKRNSLVGYWWLIVCWSAISDSSLLHWRPFSPSTDSGRRWHVLEFMNF